MTKICSKCQATNDSAAQFCSRCGTSLRQTAGRLCPAGRHTMDPNWTHCPYCEAEAQAAMVPGSAEKEKNMMRKKTSFGYENEVSGRRVTKMDDVGNQPSEKGLANSPESPPNTARIVGVLISYSRKPAGEIFPIREGKNTIGSGETSDGSPCDIWFPEDHKMSGFHALIRYLRGKYQIVDQTSTNGTFVNGEEIDKLELPNYSHLQLGRTKFLFIKTEDSTISREEARIEVEEPVVESPGPIHKPKKDPTLF